jgi:glycosyltransferase involved in cell wall biosynthesis
MSHVVFLRPDLSYSGATQRTLSTARVLLEAGAQVTIITRGGSRAAAARAHGFELRELELEPGRLGRPFLKRRLIELLSELKPTSLHVPATDLAGLGPLVARAARRLALPYVLEATRLTAQPIEFDAPLLRAVLVPSDCLAEPLVNHGRVPRELLVMLPGAPPDEPPGTRLRAPLDHTGPPVIGCTGSFDAGFAGEWFLEAARMLAREQKPWSFVMLGEGPDERKLRRRTREAGLTERVTIGVPTTDTALSTLTSLDVHVSCRTDTGPGWLALQTMRLGIPNLFAAAGEAFSLVQDQHNGILIQPGDGRRLADEIAGLVANPERARALGAAGRRTSFERSPRTAFEATVRELHGI